MGKLLFYLSWIAGVLWSFTLVVAIWDNDLRMLLLACSFLAHAALVGALSKKYREECK